MRDTMGCCTLGARRLTCCCGLHVVERSDVGRLIRRLACVAPVASQHVAPSYAPPTAPRPGPTSRPTAAPPQLCLAPSSALAATCSLVPFACLPLICLPQWPRLLQLQLPDQWLQEWQLPGLVPRQQRRARLPVPSPSSFACHSASFSQGRDFRSFCSCLLRCKLVDVLVLGSLSCLLNDALRVCWSSDDLREAPAAMMLVTRAPPASPTRPLKLLGCPEASADCNHPCGRLRPRCLCRGLAAGSWGALCVGKACLGIHRRQTQSRPRLLLPDECGALGFRPRALSTAGSHPGRSGSTCRWWRCGWAKGSPKARPLRCSPGPSPYWLNS